ncbi:MAG: 4-hydroxy-tetrahydrodipicolinate synthase [Austwickia sp.]|nr:4-hydroxy-tetrahydrodipicolinate synthase [Austwickia sp.]MBK8435021.1 4-hydroxy-tetrahydrodipicolinate synthase [Austwickia sp.]MBK9101423.1 4-hydroxy-tetrahydrodipicolinate synthase [Austwickia sp.]
MPSQPPVRALRTDSVFGRVLTAMVTPFRPDGSLDVEAAEKLACWLVDQGNEGLVVNGTTGEAPTTTDAEKTDIIRAVSAAVGDRCTIVAGVGTNDTAHTVELARQAERAGADGVLVVTPYYNKPPQEGLIAHFTAVADATELPNILYDIPGRSGIPIAVDTLIRLSEHPRICAVKDAKGDFWAATEVMRATDLAWYSGNDGDNLLHLAQGGVGLIGVTSHVASPQYARMIAAVDAGDLAGAQQIHRDLVPAVNAVMNITQGAIMSKAALVELGVLAHPTVRLPLIEATPEQRVRLRDGLVASGLL